MGACRCVKIPTLICLGVLVSWRVMKARLAVLCGDLGSSALGLCSSEATPGMLGSMTQAGLITPLMVPM